MTISYRRASFWKRQAMTCFTIAAISLLLLPTLSRAATPLLPTSLDHLVVKADLQPDGLVAISQELFLLAPGQLYWKVFSNVRGLAIEANGTKIDKRNYSVDRENGYTIITSPNTAQVWKLTYETSTTLIRSDDRDQLFLKIVESSNAVINDVAITFLLPDQVTGPGLQGNVYGISGISNSNTTVVSPRQINYSASFIGPQAILTINAHWPKSVLRLSQVQELRLTLSSLEILPWIVLGLFLPFTSLLVLLRLLYRQRRNEERVKDERATPPSALSPLIVGLLVDKKVYPKEVVALLLDLCQRGFLVIVKKNQQYYLSQRKPFTEGLESWERDILEELFPIANTKLSEQEFKLLTKQTLFSPKIRRAFSTIYESVTQMNFFAENPHLTRVRYKLLALALYFTGVIAAVWIAFSGSSPYLLMPLAGTMLISLLIAKLTPKLVRYTKEGREARRLWLAFGNFLGKKAPLPLEASIGHTFEKYLPYAISLNKSLTWAKRFDLSNTIIVKPDWFISYEEGPAVEFAREVRDFSQSISEMLTELRGPLVS